MTGIEALRDLTEAALLAERQRVKALEDALRELFADPAALSRPWEWAEREAWHAKARALLAAGETGGA